jgi:hypothetical protein
MAAYLPLYFDTQFLTDAADAASTHLLYSYQSGTTTLKATYTDATGGVANANPMALNSAARQNLWLGTGGYSFELKTPAGALVKRWDGVTTGQDISAALLSDLANATDPVLGSGLVGYGGPTLDYAADTVGAKLRERISVKDFGALGDNTADDTAAIQAAIDHAETLSAAGAASAVEIYFPGGDYKVTAKITIQDDYIRLTGDGRFASTIVVSSSIDVFEFKKSDGSILYYGGIHNIGIRSTNGANLTTGAFLKLYNTTSFEVVGCQLQGWHIGIDMIGAARCYVDKISMSQAQRTSGKALAGIRLTGDATTGVCTGNHITDIEINSNTSVIGPYSHGLLVRSSDGLYMHQLHIQDGDNDITISPDNSANNDLISSVILDDSYLDACEVNCLEVSGTAATTGKYRDITISNTVIRASNETLAQVGSSSASSPIRAFRMVNCALRLGQKAGLEFTTANVQSAMVDGCFFFDNNLSANASGHDIIIRGDGVRVINPTFIDGNAVGKCIYVDPAATGWEVVNPNFDASTRTTFIDNNAPASAGYRLEARQSSALSRVNEIKELQTTDATTSTIWSWTLGADESLILEATVHGMHSTFDKGTHVVMYASYYKDGAGVATAIGAATAVHTAETDAGFAVAVDTDGANTVRLRVTGLPATTVNWVADARAILK